MQQYVKEMEEPEEEKIEEDGELRDSDLRTYRK